MITNQHNGIGDIVLGHKVVGGDENKRKPSLMERIVTYGAGVATILTFVLYIFSKKEDTGIMFNSNPSYTHNGTGDIVLGDKVTHDAEKTYFISDRKMTGRMTDDGKYISTFVLTPVGSAHVPVLRINVGVDPSISIEMITIQGYTNGPVSTFGQVSYNQAVEFQNVAAESQTVVIITDKEPSTSLAVGWTPKDNH